MKKKMKKVPELDVFHYHEALDRCNSVAEIIEDMLLEHHVFQHPAHAHLRAKVELAQTYIRRSYQAIGRLPELDALYGAQAKKTLPGKNRPPGKPAKKSKPPVKQPRRT